MDNKNIDIKVSFTPHPWNNKNEPYFWIILEGEISKCNAGCGWAKTPQIAWEKANEYYKKYIVNRMKPLFEVITRRCITILLGGIK
jgi:hypothetical protein